MKKHTIIVACLIVVNIAVVFGLCLYKYQHNLYNGVDLAIFFQAFESLGQGDFLNVPIQGHQYWGDHFSLMFFIFYPVFFIFQHPLTLLFLQAAVTALAAWPLYLISKKYLSAKFCLLIVAVFLFNPLIISMNLFEFHFLPFIFFFFFFLFYFYLKKNWLGFYIFLFLCLFIREDISLFILGFVLFVFIEKVRETGFKKIFKRHEIIMPFFICIAWFIGSWFLIKYFNAGPNKFLIYFGWITNWKTFIFHFINFFQLELLFQIFLPFAFLPLFKPKYLIIGLFYYLEIAAAYGAPIAHLHYGAPLLVPAFIGTVFVLADWQKKKYKNFYLELFRKISAAVLICALIYFNFFWNPVRALGNKNENANLENYFIKKIQTNSKVLAPARLFPKLVADNEVFSAGRAFWGYQQFSEQAYDTGSLDYVLIDLDELMANYLQKDKRRYYKEKYDQGKKNLKRIIEINELEIKETWGQYLLFARDEAAQTRENKIIGPFGREYKKITLEEYPSELMRIAFYENDNKIKEQIMLPFISEIYVPALTDKISITPVEVEGYLTLTKLNEAINVITVVKPEGDEVFID